MNTTMRATYKKCGGSWRGAIKVGKETVWVCEHSHNNRDLTTYTNGRSAVDCAVLEVRRRERGTLGPLWFDFCAAWGAIGIAVWRDAQEVRPVGCECSCRSIPHEAMERGSHHSDLCFMFDTYATR